MALYYLNMCMAEEYPFALHTFGEVIQYQLFDLDNQSIALYNLTTVDKKCEVSVQFYAKSILRGYLKSWLQLAEKRYLL